MTVKVAVFSDWRFVSSATPTGVGKHMDRMVSGLQADPGFELTALSTRDQCGIDVRGLRKRVVPLSWHMASTLWMTMRMPKADSWLDGADWLYCPKNDFVPLRSVKSAVTIHGASELDPAFVRVGATAVESLRNARSWLVYRRIRDDADVVLTVSEWLKEFISSHLGIEGQRIVVVGNGVDEEFFGTRWLGPASETHSPYILCIGGLNYLDGGDRIVALAKEMARIRSPLRIKVAGHQHEAAIAADASGLAQLELLGYRSKKDLAHLLRDAVALYYPTRYETFGMGAAEAMAVGVPVITTRCTAVPEIVGTCGHYVDADNVSEVVECIGALLEPGFPALEESNRSRERAAIYSWKHCVSRLTTVLAGQGLAGPSGL